MAKYLFVFLVIIFSNSTLEAQKKGCSSCPSNQNSVATQVVNGETLTCCSGPVDEEDVCDTGIMYYTQNCNGELIFSGCSNDDSNNDPTQCIWTKGGQAAKQTYRPAK